MQYLIFKVFIFFSVVSSLGKGSFQIRIHPDSVLKIISVSEI
ncbi:hypothetical protein CU040_1766 [Enterococcus faecium]|nr:hypothetical protein [Enterococcus faecium]